MGVKVAKFLDIADGLKPKQFSVGDKYEVSSISELPPIYKEQLMDKPYPVVLAVMGGNGRPNLTPMWFDYEGDKILVNVASHRKKTSWIRKTPHMTMLIINPANMYHWISFKISVEEELSEDDPTHGPRVTTHLNKIAKKYINQDVYPLRDPSINERRVLFVCKVDSIATFGQP